MLHDYIIATYGVQLHCPIQVSSSVSQAVTHRLYRVLETIREKQLNFYVEASATKKGVLAFFSSKPARLHDCMPFDLCPFDQKTEHLVFLPNGNRKEKLLQL